VRLIVDHPSNCSDISGLPKDRPSSRPVDAASIAPGNWAARPWWIARPCVA